MFENEAMRKTLIIILTILLAILVIVGLVVMNKGEKKTDTKEKNKTNANNLCVEKLCISKVSIEEVKNSKAIYLELQNTNKKTLENFCVIVKTNELEIPTCIESIEPNKTVVYIYEYNDEYGKKLKDYSLEKAKD